MPSVSERRAEGPKPAAMRVKLKYPDVDAFLNKYGPDLARGRVFIPTRSPRPVGSLLRFEIMLTHEGEERSILRGEGTVQLVRGPDAQGRSAGIGLKLTRVFGDGQALLDRAAAARVPREAAARDITGEVELTSPRDIDSGEYPAVPRPDPEPSETAQVSERIEPAVTAPVDNEQPIETAQILELRAPSTPPPVRPPLGPHVDVDALAAEWQISSQRVDEILRRRRPRDPALGQELDALLRTEAPADISPEEATQRLAQLLDRRRGPR